MPFLILFAALNAVLYSALLPLWEGFDEPFHFGYVQQLANGEGFPDARTARLSQETAESVLRAPASEAVKSNLPEVVSYAEFFSFPPEQRSRIHRSLREIPPAYRWRSSELLNYEAPQAPLAYILLAVPERMLASVPLPSRVLILRILAGLAGSLFLCAGAAALSSQLGLSMEYRNIALFCILCSQMTWATLAHVANDWFAVPLAVWSLVFAIRCACAPSNANFAIASLLVSCGLLTKAYFLALVPLLVGVCVFRKGFRGLAMPVAILVICAAPWYVRNYRLYGTVSGMQEARAGIGAAEVAGAAPRLNWPKVAVDSARAALWTGNNTFRSFSVKPINLVIAGCAVALLLGAFRRHTLTEWTIVAYCTAFLLAFAYDGVVAFINTRGAASTPAAWYLQVLVGPVLILALAGAGQSRRAGPVLAGVLTLLFGYLSIATYAVKLIPLYAGYEGRTSLSNIATLYRTQFGELTAKLNSVALGPAWLIFGLTICVIVLVIAQEILLIRGIAQSCFPDRQEHRIERQSRY